MQRVVNFYEKLPRGAAPEAKATGLLGRYQAKHFGKNPTSKREFYSQEPRRQERLFPPSQKRQLIRPHLAIVHAIVLLLIVGYAQNYYFHLRKFRFPFHIPMAWFLYMLTLEIPRSPQEQRALSGMELGVEGPEARALYIRNCQIEQDG
jgi:hypothetical protein